MVDTVITRPVVNASLIGNGVAKHKKEANGEGGTVGTMRPKTMHSDCYTKATVVNRVEYIKMSRVSTECWGRKNKKNSITR